MAVLTLAYNSRPHRKTSVAPLDFVTPRRLTNFCLDRIPDGLSTAGRDPRDQNAAFLGLLKGLLFRVKDCSAKTQARYKRDYDRNVRPKNKKIKDGDWLYVESHSRTRGKLDSKTAGAYEILDTDGWTFLSQIDGSPYRVSSDHVTRAPPPSRRDLTRRERTAVPIRALEEGRELVYVKSADHAWEDGKLHLKVRWFGFNPEDDTWEPLDRLPLADVVAYTKRHGIEGTAVGSKKLSRRGQEGSGKDDEASSDRTDTEESGTSEQSE